MRREIFRMEWVTYAEQGVKQLENFNMHIYTGEVMGLIPVNAHGKNAILMLLQNNLALFDGYIYYSGELVNSWRGAVKRSNRVSIIQSRSCLVNGMTVADNIFVLRQGSAQSGAGYIFGRGDAGLGGGPEVFLFGQRGRMCNAADAG